MRRLKRLFENCKKEEEVKEAFLREFGEKLNALGQIDHYSERILYEFKNDKDFSKKHNQAYVVAQTLYYVRKLVNPVDERYAGTVVPPVICVVDKLGGFFVKTEDFRDFYKGRREKKYDWSRAASVPCPVLVKDLENSSQIEETEYFDFDLESDEDRFRELYKGYSFQSELLLKIKKDITADNFWIIFKEWNRRFSSSIHNGHTMEEYFLSDIENGNTCKVGSNNYDFKFGSEIKRQKIKSASYDKFWDGYEKIDPSKMHLIRQRKAILGEDYKRRRSGEYYTPREFARRGIEYLEKTLGVRFWESGEYRIWDMAAGTGNLELDLPSSALKYCYISTIEQDDIDYCKRIFPDAKVFQYDYLNDDIDIVAGNIKYSSPKMPKELFDEIRNPKLKWVILLNPPYKTAQNKRSKVGMKTWDKVSSTSVRLWMEQEDLLETSRELYLQFLFRIKKEFKGEDTTLCLYSTVKYINSNNDQRARDTFIKWTYKRGFMFDAACFYKAKGGFPVGHAVWSINEERPLEEQEIVFDVLNEYAEKVGTKKIVHKHRDNLLNRWVPREKNVRVMVPFSSAFSVASEEHKDVRDRVAGKFICSFCSNSDAMHARKFWSLLSAPHVSAGAFSVTPFNFEKAMIAFAMKRIPMPTWTNNRDNYYEPLVSDFPREFVSDCVVWTCFAENNYVTSLKDVQWNGKTWRIENQMFPFSIDELRSWNISDDDIKTQLIYANDDRFLARWLSSSTLSSEAMAVLESAKRLYMKVFANLSNLDWDDAHICSWDFGFYQLRRAIRNSHNEECELEELTNLHNALEKKLLTKVYEYGFLENDVEYFEEE